MPILKPTADSVKYIGRTLYQDSILWLALSGSGITFTFHGKQLSVTLQGDDHTSADTDHARIGVFINGERILDTMIKEPQTTYTLLQSEKLQTCTVSVLKLSEAPMSIVGIESITTDDAASLTPAPARQHRIEFIGDSITCGYGTDDKDLSHSFTTASEDVTKAFAYRTASLLDTDYSMVSYSGYGVYSGFTDTDIRNTVELLPLYYPMVGFSRGTWKGNAITTADWDFTSYVPDLIVINLGTNDDSYCQDIPDRQEQFTRCYKDFLEMVRSYNPHAMILCVYGVMNNRLLPFLEKAIKEYKKETGDTHICYLPLPTHTEADGYVIDYHPSLYTHEKISRLVASKIKELMGW